jgi:hypothetical protein
MLDTNQTALPATTPTTPVNSPAQVAPVAPNIPIFEANPNNVYTTANINSASSNPAPDYSKMKLNKLEKAVANAQSTSELNQIQIMNQTKAMGVLTGEAGYQNKLDTARINAITGMYNVKLLEQQRKDEKNKLKEQYKLWKKQQDYSNKMDFDTWQKKYNIEKSGKGGASSADIKTANENYIYNQLSGASKGNDGFVDPSVWKTALKGWQDAGGTTSSFLTTYGGKKDKKGKRISGFINPNDF